MKARLLTCVIEQETDIVQVRQRTRKIASLIGFDTQDQTRITTAVSEITRNAFEYGRGGRIEYWLDGDAVPQTLEIIVQDSGGGIADLDAVLSGAYRSNTGMGVGIVGARRLMEQFEIETAAAGTKVRMTKQLPRRAPLVTAKALKTISRELEVPAGFNPLDEIRQQNQEMLAQLEQLQRRERELDQLNQELQDTNRGVVALYAELDERADHLRRADELKSRFLSNMTHEFRTPLNSILALSRLLLLRTDGELSPEQERQIQFVRKAAENLSELVNDLLDLAKVQAGKTVVTPTEFTATSLFGALRGMLRPLLVGDAVNLAFEDGGDLPPLVTDEGKVSQILRNFLSNAIKFTEHGEVRVWAQMESDADEMTFKVRDTGIGIAPENMDIIWQEFGQIANPIQTRVRGTGLGLPLSKRLAELLGGRVAVESWPGQGSVFSLTVPRHYRQPDEALLDGKWVLDPDRIPILCVEDNDADTFAYERAVVSSAYQIIPASSVAMAKRALERFKPAAVLLDIKLAGEESWRLLIDLKHNELTQDIPVIVISSNQEETKARDLGADEYLNKPVDSEVLIATLDQMTGSHSVINVLVVDDEEVSRYLVRQLLPRGAFRLSEAINGAEGLQRVRDDRPDIVLLDLNMPSMDGFDFLTQLSSGDEAESPIAIVLTSATLDDFQRRRLTKAFRIISKADLSSGTLVSAIQQAVESREAART